jgi:hypothetical protein
MRRIRRDAIATLAVIIAVACGLFAACSPARPEGLDPSKLPVDVQGDYAVFAQRCSKCHSLARPLDSGIDDDDYWRSYVARMRRMPASGISADDEVQILRFLHYYSMDLRAKKKAKEQGG